MTSRHRENVNRRYFIKDTSLSSYSLSCVGSHVTKLVPKLTPVEECVDVPKEVCQKSKGNPRKVLKPVTKKWCYVPSEESGLH